jgi:hypothetical protein
MSDHTDWAWDILNECLIKIDLEGREVLPGRWLPRAISDIRYNLIRLTDGRVFVAKEDSFEGYVNLDFDAEYKRRRVKFAQLSLLGARL